MVMGEAHSNMKILLRIPIDPRRSEIAPIIIDGVRRLKESCPYDLTVMGISPTAEGLQMWSSVLDHEVMAFSENLNDTLNQAIEYTLFLNTFYGLDYMLEMGCDDIISPEYWQFASKYYESGEDAFGVSVVRIWDIHNDKAFDAHYPMVVGAARAIKVDKYASSYAKYMYIYTPGLDNGHGGQDYQSEQLMQINPVDISQGEVLLTDIKDGFNICPYDTLLKFRKKNEYGFNEKMV